MNLELCSVKIVGYPDAQNTQRVYEKIRSAGYTFTICCCLPHSGSKNVITIHLNDFNLIQRRVHAVPHDSYIRENYFDISSIFTQQTLNYPKRFIWSHLIER